MKKTVSLTEVQLKDIINRVVSEQLKDMVSSVASSQNNMIALCADLGVKTVGYCDTKAKKPIKSCAEMGIKTPGFCYVDTKQPVPGIKKSTNTIKEQASQVASALKPAMVTKPQGGQIPFNPTHIGGYEVDCKSKQVKLNTKNKVFLKPLLNLGLLTYSDMTFLKNKEQRYVITNEGVEFLKHQKNDMLIQLKKKHCKVLSGEGKK
jgi:hypothetical protein